MAKSKLSVLGIYNYQNDIFADLTVPTGMNKDTVVDRILLETADLEVLYPDPTVLKLAIKRWSESSQYSWDRLYKSTLYDYNPIWNKDGIVQEVEKIGSVGKEKLAQTKENSTNQHASAVESQSADGSSSQDQHNTQVSTSVSEGSSDSTETTTDMVTENEVAGFNANTYQDHDKSTTNGTVETENTGTQNESSSAQGHANTSGYDHQETNGTSEQNAFQHESGVSTADKDTQNDQTRVYTREERGNIGVTTTQQMLQEEREIALFSVYDFIVNDFRRRFCLLIY